MGIIIEPKYYRFQQGLYLYLTWNYKDEAKNGLNHPCGKQKPPPL